MRATLGTRINLGQSCIVCPRCGFWQAFEPQIHVTKTATTTTMDYRGLAIDFEDKKCPDCQGFLDAVVPPPQVVKP